VGHAQGELLCYTQADLRTVRLPSGTRSRRPSHRSSVTSIATHRSSVTSIATQAVTTPPTDDELPPWSEQSSYDFPSNHGAKVLDRRPQSSHPSSSMSVLSWPGMQPAIEMRDPSIVFRENYTMGSKHGGPTSSVLPPLSVAIDRRASYYSPY
jgi:hypothetical protein